MNADYVLLIAALVDSTTARAIEQRDGQEQRFVTKTLASALAVLAQHYAECDGPGQTHNGPTMDGAAAAVSDASVGVRALAHASAQLAELYMGGRHVSSMPDGQHSLSDHLAKIGRLGGFTKRQISDAVLLGLGKAGVFETYQVGRARDAKPKIRPVGFHGTPAGTATN